VVYDDDVLDEDWFKYRMVRSHRLVSLFIEDSGIAWFAIIIRQREI
jgi:hypothetical protein